MSLVLLPVPRPRRRPPLDRHPSDGPEVRSRLAELAGRLRRWVTAHVTLTRADLLSGTRAFLSQVVVVFGLMYAYHLARALADGKTGVAFAHSDEVWHLERWLRLPSELPLAHWFLTHPSVAHVADSYYMIHFPVTGAALVWIYLRARSVYRPMRDALFLLTAAGLVLAFLYPLAPPRMRGDLGFTDIAATFGQSVYGPVGSGTANQFAAMPSLHVGWAVLVGAAMVAAGRSRWRWLWLAHPVITVTVVVGTANHYWADGIVAVLLLLVAAAAAFGLEGRRRRRLRAALPGQRDAAERAAAEPVAAEPVGSDHPFATQPSPESAAQAGAP